MVSPKQRPATPLPQTLKQNWSPLGDQLILHKNFVIIYIENKRKGDNNYGL